MHEAPKDSRDRDCCLKWSNYQSQFSDIVRELVTEESMVDVTLAVGRERINAHRIVLSACSSLFQELLSEVHEEHPVIIFSDMSPQIVRLIIEYTYHGEVRVPSEFITLFLETAQLLKIIGLMEIGGLEDGDVKDFSPDNTEFIDVQEEKNVSMDSEEQQFEESSENSLQFSVLDDTEVANKRRRKRRESVKREYSEDMLESAINMLKAGKTIVEAATGNNIPRSTLYMRAKSLGLQMNASRNEYPVECMKAAIQTVLSGSSLQQAAEMYNIPKTVLWRRIQKEGFRILRTDCGRKYDSDKRQAAVAALARGENLTKVSLNYQIPKTTLFRDKLRLISEGKLPLTYLRKRKIEDDTTKKFRLEKAVAACRSGEMSQATASATFQVPKTTIWRRLKQNGKKSKNSSTELKTVKINEEEQNEIAYEYCEAASHDMPITYIDENTIPENSVIILTTDETGGLNLDNRQVIVDQETEHDYIKCHVNLDNDSNFEPVDSDEKI